MNRDMEQNLGKRLQALFGTQARCEGPLASSGAGRRFTGVNLWPKLTPEQVTFLDALSQFGIVTIPGQD